MKRRRILVRPAAQNDLDDQAEILARRQDVETALKFYQAAENVLALLASHPLMGRVTEFRNPALRGMRMLRIAGFTRHLVFYRPIQNGIEVIRVIHASRDVETLLED